jgi:hypothetical protein
VPQGQPPLDQATLDQIIDHALDQNRGHGAGTDESQAEGPTPAGYTPGAQRSADRPRATGSISILACGPFRKYDDIRAAPALGVAVLTKETT